MMFDLHYLAQIGIINIVRLANYLTNRWAITLEASCLNWWTWYNWHCLSRVQTRNYGIRISVCVRGFIQAPGHPSRALPG